MRADGSLRDPALHRFASLSTTMDVARRLAEAGHGHGTVVIAGEQTAGRGRAGRVWRSPPGNLYMTAVLRPGGPPHLAPQLALLVAVALADAVDGLAGPATQLKWPNDVLRDGAKLAGVLLERLDSGVVLAGIGLNVTHYPADLPYAATSLAALGHATSVAVAETAVLSALAHWWEEWSAGGLAPVLVRWLRAGPPPGSELLVRSGAETLRGRFAGLRHDGCLLLDTAAGRHVIAAGEVHSCTTAPGMAKTQAC